MVLIWNDNHVLYMLGAKPSQGLETFDNHQHV